MKRGDVRRVELRELQGAVEDIRYQKRDDGQHYVHDVESDNELWLVDVAGKKGTLMLPRDKTPLWTKDGGDTYWLNNPPRARGKRGTMARTKKRAAARRRTTTRRKTRRSPPAGFATWSDYMASIRPKPKGGLMAARSKRRRSTKRRKTARRRRHVAVAHHNPPKRRARRHRRNPPMIPSVGNIVNRVKSAAIGGAAIVAGEAGARLTRSRLFGMSAGTITGAAVEFAAGTVLGIIAEKVAGADVGQNVTNGAFAGVFRAAAKQIGTQYGLPFVAEALGDGGGRSRYVIRNGKVIPAGRLNGYVNNGLNGYVNTPVALNGGYADTDTDSDLFGG